MKIKVKTTFLDGLDRYEKDDIRTVPDEKGTVFVANAWAVKAGDEALATEPFTTTPSLNIKSASHKSGVKHG